MLALRHPCPPMAGGAVLRGVARSRRSRRGRAGSQTCTLALHTAVPGVPVILPRSWARHVLVCELLSNQI